MPCPYVTRWHRVSPNRRLNGQSIILTAAAPTWEATTMTSVAWGVRIREESAGRSGSKQAARHSAGMATTRGRAGIVALLFTDLANSRELLERAGDEATQGLLRAHYRLLKTAVGMGGGHEVKWLGDGWMVAFRAAVDAARCAIAMQQAAQRRAVGTRLAVRVGLNVGE